MGNLDPIAYTYEADHHCVSCAIDRFGTAENGWVVPDKAVDGEGNHVVPLAPWDEWWDASFDGEDEQRLICGTCGTEIDSLDT